LLVHCIGVHGEEREDNNPSHHVCDEGVGGYAAVEEIDVFETLGAVGHLDDAKSIHYR
jgi:hypothetical protein